MKQILLLTLLLLLLASHGALGSPADEQRLQEENAQLKAEIQALKKAAAPNSPAAESSKTATSSAPATATPSTPAPASSSQNLNLGLPAGTGAPGTYSPAEIPSNEATPPAAPPPGYRLVKEPERYSETGCTHGLFETTADAAWKHSENWSSLRKGIAAGEVENDLGIEHFNIEKGKRVIWQYGKCGSTAQGFVVLEDNAVVFWSVPDF